MRVASVDAQGRVENRYPSTAPVSGAEPVVPWAVYLTDARGRFRLLGFDLDAKAGPVESDLARLRQLLGRAGVPHVVCRSGPGGGRHVWAAVGEPVPAPVVARLARGLRQLLPSLDVSALLNPATGALRPPGAPHRLGGRSEILAGDVSALLSPTAGVHAVLTLAGLVGDPPPRSTATTDGAMPVGRDEHGHPHLLGDRRPLPPAAQAALTSPLPAEADASRVLFTVLCGAARARWRRADLDVHVAAAAGLEHVRTRRHGPLRVARDQRVQREVLDRNWRRAVAWIAAHPTDPTDTAGADPTWLPRCTAVTDAVAGVQRRADASPGRWATGGGPADRRVLDVLCLLQLDAVRPDGVEADIRRLSQLTGLGRDTARIALLRLAADGWIVQVRPAEGVHAAHWTIHTSPPTLSTPEVTSGRSQADTRPDRHLPLDVPAARNAWRSHLRHRTTAVAHDVFTANHGLAHHCARTYQALTTAEESPRILADRLGYTLPRTLAYLERLHRHRLARTDPAGHWLRPGRDQRDAAATAIGAAGVLAARTVRHETERTAWAWWLDELAWRRLSPARRRRTPGADQAALPLPELPAPRRRHGPHPVHRGRADYAAALAHLRNELHRQAS
ncbi:hypothetical protein GCM10011594_40060 [Nakamurella endophytica]|uniref:Uncharacterized protein n=1 Tax=Nakamurella endophytica TaxID=1748367 RepID=A0A917WNA3_9ACTN|nr:hypothetical protein GCM10011594_40060 [Nakamurella endophytica]